MLSVVRSLVLKFEIGLPKVHLFIYIALLTSYYVVHMVLTAQLRNELRSGPNVLQTLVVLLFFNYKPKIGLKLTVFTSHSSYITI